MRISRKTLMHDGFSPMPDGGYKKGRVILWWSPQGYQIDGTRVKVHTMEELTKELNLNSVLKFGKYEGKTIREIEDAGYLKWLVAKADERIMGHGVVTGAKIKLKQIEYYAR